MLTNFLCTLIFAFAYPETRGKSLEQIDLIFGDVIPSAVGDYSSSVEKGSGDVTRVEHRGSSKSE